MKACCLGSLCVECADGSGLVRPSNTTPIIVLPDNDATLKRIQDEFRAVLLVSSPTLTLPF